MNANISSTDLSAVYITEAKLLSWIKLHLLFQFSIFIPAEQSSYQHSILLCFLSTLKKIETGGRVPVPSDFISHPFSFNQETEVITSQYH